MMPIVFLFLRRMRRPLVVLVCAYALSIIGFVLIPGQDAHGRVWQMDFFHAIYFVSFMGSTIGFGELPYPFTGAQRLWTVFTIYATVVAWLYAIGTLIALLQTPRLAAAIARHLFIRRVKKFRQRFYLICGYGDTATLLVHGLSQYGIYCSVIDRQQSRISQLELQPPPAQVAALCDDAADTNVLLDAGLTSPDCAGVVALTPAAEVNLKIAVTSKLLNPRIPVYCWADTRDDGNNLASFGTNHIINPYDIFAEHFARALASPSQYLLREWLSAAPGTPRAQPIFPPRGAWILCGYGRFGKALYRVLQAQGLPTVVVENDPVAKQPPVGSIHGRGTEAATLHQAQIDQAVGIIAGTDHDVNNLSIIMTAKKIRPDLFSVARQELAANRDIFAAAPCDLVTHHSNLITQQLLALMTTPLTWRFLQRAEQQTEAWAYALSNRLRHCSAAHNPARWVISLTPQHAAAVFERFAQRDRVELQHLLRHPHQREQQLPCIALLLQRGHDDWLLPDATTALKPDDRILFAGDPSAHFKLRHLCSSVPLLHYSVSGENRPVGYIWNKLTDKPALPVE